ncbi:MAG: carboxymuconolactone decarboxylase family protein [Phycisphaeraceae bacterium]|nr:carboxymuconolactone decarboxylase family protein [Phycisphaeraceae bacterium]MCW5754713.1 carboxymuconolactone decarboxylase family protein [Phycisphaeraceae bacterium]
MSATPSRYEQFHDFRTRMNERILGDDASRGMHPDGSARVGGTLVTKRFFSLDAQAYRDGALPARTKELLGLAASMVLRCDDCIAYHIDQCIRLGVRDEELWETFDIALIVGGSIVIPHLRRAAEFVDACRANSNVSPDHGA